MKWEAKMLKRICHFSVFAKMRVFAKFSILLKYTAVLYQMVALLTLSKCFAGKKATAFIVYNTKDGGRISLTAGFKICDTMQRRSDYVFPEIKLCGLSPNFYIHISVSDLYIPAAK
jgi:hypothetical protein